ncbi:MAG TPA: hypothetical protein VMC62_03085 [Longilinea sp.]|nr:hypothetical protein [Longilinea sp.]
MSSGRTLWISLSVVSILALSFLMSACGASNSPTTRTAGSTATGASPVVTATPVPAGELSEKIVRYILVDSQLGNRIDEYRKVIDQPNAAEAVCRWDKGVRVQNIDKFERKVVGSQGWNVVYAGTDTIINGMDVTLTSNEICAATATPAQSMTGESTATAAAGTPQAVATAVPAFEADDPQCQNSYWPIVTGSHWEYKVTDNSGKESQESVSISKVWQDSGKSYFNVTSSLFGTSTYQCVAGAIFDSDDHLVLPAQGDMLAGKEFGSGSTKLTVNGAASTKSDAGIFETVGVCGTNHCEYYAEDVGLISASEKDYSKFLTNFLLPR